MWWHILIARASSRGTLEWVEVVRNSFLVAHYPFLTLLSLVSGADKKKKEKESWTTMASGHYLEQTFFLHKTLNSTSSLNCIITAKFSTPQNCRFSRIPELARWSEDNVSHTKDWLLAFLLIDDGRIINSPFQRFMLF
eukprot:sb/3474481/